MSDIVLLRSSELKVALRTEMTGVVVATSIVISPTEAGFALAYLLDPAVYEYADEAEAEISIPYTAEVDQRLRRLYDLAANLRLSAPGIVQLALTFNPLRPT